MPKAPGSSLVVPTVEQRHRAFADAYLAFDYNATRAYKYVYGDSIDDHSAAVNGSRLLRNADIAEIISEAKAKQQSRMHIRQDEPVRQYLNILKSDVRSLFSPSGAMRQVHELDDETAMAVQSIKVKRYPNHEDPSLTFETVEYKFHSKIAAANAMSEILGLTKAAEAPAGTTNIVARQVIIVGGREIEF